MNREQKRLGNKGFSLVELIVVIAIMAVLIAVIAPTLISKIEESREGTDLQALGEVRSAVVDALADEEIYKIVVDKDNTTTFTLSTAMVPTGITDTDDKLQNELKEIIGDNIEWQSNALENDDETAKAITIKVSNKGKVFAYIAAEEGDTATENGALDTGDTKFEAGTPIS